MFQLGLASWWIHKNPVEYAHVSNYVSKTHDFIVNSLVCALSKPFFKTARLI